MDSDLRDKVAVISGASHGLGQAVAQDLAARGVHVVMIARGEQRLQQAADDIRASGGVATVMPCDVSDAAQVQKAAVEVQESFGAVDILVNNAGIPAPRTFLETDSSDWDAVIGVNLSGVFYLTRALWDCLLRADSACVINISGTAGARGGGSPAYGSAKFGLTGLNHAIALAGVDHNIRSTILYPGGMDTGWRGAPIGEMPRSESMDPAEVARFITGLVSSPPEFVVNEAVLNPLDHPYM
ncbi:MAG: SDR family NAD(P)-dependent oxidoreductase [Chloroflexi bacterium]|nr:SDR family NAD(P)-dependent oxidoreductase [Chloroflexota bacterium]